MKLKTKAASVNLYDREATRYIKFVKDSFSWRFLEKPSFEKHLAPLLKKDFEILDVGCGEGRVIDYLLSKGISAKNLIGVDASGAMIAAARQNLPRVNFVHTDIVSPNLHFKGLDLITSSMVFFYLDEVDWKRALANFYRWLKPGGLLFYIVAHPVRLVYNNISHYFERGWYKQGTPWGTEVPHFRRTVGDYLNPTIAAGFILELIDEPEVPESAKKYPADYRKYRSFPPRLVVRARRV